MTVLKLANGVPVPARPSVSESLPLPFGTSEKSITTLRHLSESINSFNSNQSNKDLLDRIRSYNHEIVRCFDDLSPLADTHLLDIGASPHQYAMEKSVECGVACYVGVGLDIDTTLSVDVLGSRCHLRNMNAQSLQFENNSFDRIMSMSTFEHIADVPQALSEIHRVLRPGGTALITFEPLWTCSYGHHLHQYEEIAQLVPPWAHLIWNRDQMREYLSRIFPENASLDLEQTIHWIYENPVINRVGISEMRDHIYSSALNIVWIVPIPETTDDEGQLHLASDVTGYSYDDLMTRGLSIFMKKIQ
ncbi:MAG: methyltransferase domain-containing protein [Xanthomonadaceae bacterium]|jgi:SAM-dependent methyltransferase|nr:methyltransferase domain-containing protein [Xanthomonadaceae bacterium]